MLRLIPMRAGPVAGMRLTLLSSSTLQPTLFKPRHKATAKTGTPVSNSTPARPPPEKSVTASRRSLPPQDMDIETPVVINGEVRGRLKVRIDGVTQTKAFDYQALRILLADAVSNDVLAGLDAVAGGRAFVPFLQTEAYRVPIRFDEDQLAVVVTIAPGFTRAQPFPVRAPYRRPGAEVVRPAAVSAYLNMRAALDYQQAPVGAWLQPLRVNLDGAINVKGWVLEGQGDYIASHAVTVSGWPTTWQRGNVRLVKDDVAHMLRFGIGDLSYPVSGFQGFSPMAGLSVARNFSLQPYTVFQPTGQSSIFLTSPSQVEVFINGNRDRILHLNAGNYSLSDFPVVDGANDVHLLITDSAGRVEEHTLSIFTNANLLKRGVQSFSYNLGVASSLDNGRITYGHDLTFSGFESYGLTDRWTVGGNAQGDRHQQMAGLTSAYQSPIGNLQLDLAASHDTASGAGTAGRLQYSYADAHAQAFDVAVGYRDPEFHTLGQNGRNLEHYTLSARYSRSLLAGIQAALSTRFVRQRGAPGQLGTTQWAYSANLSKYIGRSLSLSANIGASSTEHINMFLTLSWIPGINRTSHSGSAQQSVNVTYDSASDTTRGDWNYSAGNHGDALSATASLVQSHGLPTTPEGEIEFSSYRYEISAQRTAWRPGLAMSEARFASALVYAGGQWALSRPISDSFALIYPHEDLRGHTIGVNPSLYNGHDTAFEARADRWGAAVLPNMAAYYDRPITIDTRLIPAGFDIGASQFVLSPTYKSGIAVQVGSGADAYARGRLTDAEGHPVALVEGEVTGVKGFDRQMFTDRNGVFYIYGLHKGSYHLAVAGRAEAGLNFTITSAAGKLVELGTLILPAVHDRVIRP